MLRIRRLQIHNFKSLVHFDLPMEHLTGLIGLNGAGKSTLLQALDFLCQLFRGDLEGYLSRRGWKLSDLRSRTAEPLPKWLYPNTDFPDFPMEGAFLRSRSGLIRFRVLFEDDESGEIGRRPWMSWYGEIDATKGGLSCLGEKYLDSEGMSFTVHEGRYYSDPPPEGYDGRSEIAFKYQGSILSQLLETQTRQISGLERLKRFLVEERSLELLAPNLIRKKERKEDSIGLGGERLAGFIHALPEDRRGNLQERIARFAPALRDIRIRKRPGGTKELIFSETQGQKIVDINERYVNDGTLRLLAILGQLEEEPSLLLLDEIENGIHPERIRDLIDLLLEAPSQVLFTTHSPMILNYLPDDVARRGVVFLYRDRLGHTRAKRFFDLSDPSSKLGLLGPGEVFADTPLEELAKELADAPEEAGSR
ncbi:conserved hypothetical protein [Aminomonas paucivorans DSM 12260]|uniref:SMC domain protein n=1 Tax=Aminomonas paucivorans DSM 12260 TaxID=584708 RepID=E3CX44_9BACT|nr:ATP-binding protein [Aminomonas paucivorans]EFQ24391.1 conserved hypothetical protein [Aminomonas paucivorans DSM 12260]